MKSKKIAKIAVNLALDFSVKFAEWILENDYQGYCTNGICRWAQDIEEPHYLTVELFAKFLDESLKEEEEEEEEE